MIIETHISHGYVRLLEIFFKANNLAVKCEERVSGVFDQINLVYEDDSDTAITLTFMGMKHLGVENMLCDYLIRCGVSKDEIAVGRELIKRDMKKLDEAWEKHRYELGFR